MVAEKTYAEDLHLVSHQTGMHAVLRLIPVDPATGDRAVTRVDATPACSAGAVRAGAIELAYENARHRTPARGRGLDVGVSAAATP